MSRSDCGLRDTCGLDVVVDRNLAVLRARGDGLFGILPMATRRKAARWLAIRSSACSKRRGLPRVCVTAAGGRGRRLHSGHRAGVGSRAVVAQRDRGWRRGFGLPPSPEWKLGAALGDVGYPNPGPDFDDLFLFEAKRRVMKDRTVSLNGRLYEADTLLVGHTVVLRYDPAAPPNRPPAGRP